VGYAGPPGPNALESSVNKTDIVIRRFTALTLRSREEVSLPASYENPSHCRRPFTWKASSPAPPKGM